MYYFFRRAVWLVPRLPRWFLRLLPGVIGPLAWLLAGPARRSATRNASYVLGPEIRSTAAGRRKLRRVVRGMFRHGVSNYLDALLLSTRDDQEALQHFSIEGLECLEEALALGKGVLFFSAHLGPFERMNRWFATRDYEVTIPVERLQDERMLRLMVDLRNRSGVTYLPLGGSAPVRAIIQALRKNQIVLLVTDRAITGESVIVDFFGKPARLPIGPVNLSLRTGAPLVGAFGWYSSRDCIQASFTRLTLGLSAEERLQPDVIEAALIRQMEQAISAHPEQWVVFSPVWDASPAEKNEYINP